MNGKAILLRSFRGYSLIVYVKRGPNAGRPHVLDSLHTLIGQKTGVVTVGPLRRHNLRQFATPRGPFRVLAGSRARLTDTCCGIHVNNSVTLLGKVVHLLVRHSSTTDTTNQPSLLSSRFVRARAINFSRLHHSILGSR